MLEHVLDSKNSEELKEYLSQTMDKSSYHLSLSQINSINHRGLVNLYYFLRHHKYSEIRAPGAWWKN